MFSYFLVLSLLLLAVYSSHDYTIVLQLLQPLHIGCKLPMMYLHSTNFFNVKKADSINFTAGWIINRRIKVRSNKSLGCIQRWRIL
jgi:hypothetical protein